MAVTTAAKVRAQVPEILNATGEDANLTVLIAGIGAAFGRWCGYPPATAGAVSTMESASYVFYLTGNRTRDLVLPIQPVTAIASIYDDPDLEYTDSSRLLSSTTDYALIWDPMRGPVVRQRLASTFGAWSSTEGAIKIACTAGFTTVPADVDNLAIMAVRAWVDRRKTRGKNSESANGGSIQYADEEFLPEFVRVGLAPYRLASTAIFGVTGQG